MAKFKLPERIEVMTALPRNPMNKVVRSALQDAIS
jgi:acyl-coenzyme A synthetase/AMP-(fatty) acid ligase